MDEKTEAGWKPAGKRPRGGMFKAAQKAVKRAEKFAVNADEPGPYSIRVLGMNRSQKRAEARRLRRKS